MPQCTSRSTAVVVLEHRFSRTPDGAVWTESTFDRAFWERYLDVFDHVRLAARVADVAEADPSWKRADGTGISFAPVPFYVGPEQFVRRYAAVRGALKRAVGPQDAVILRVPGTLGMLAARGLRASGHPFALEVVGDPYDVFAPGSVRHPLRPVLRWYGARELRRLCARASAASYVTEHSLQRRYPPAPGAFATHYSSVELPPEAFAPEPRLRLPAGRPVRLVMVGTLAQMYKAPDVLLRAVAGCLSRGDALELTLVGEGKHRSEMEALARELGVDGAVRFAGRVPAGEGVRAELDRADLFVLPSHQEGLPRAAIEAMARGLPVIGSTVGGFPELLEPDAMVPPGDVERLAARIHAWTSDPARLERASRDNLERAQAYRQEALRRRRTEMYRSVREITERWAGRGGAPA